jgi:hypothetical protein
VEAMLERSPIAEPGSVAQFVGNLVLPRLAALLSQQEKLLEHPLSGADLYLYDLQAQQIYDLISELENDATARGDTSSFGLVKSPHKILLAASGSASIEFRAAKPYSRDVAGRLAAFAASIWELISNVFAGIRSFLSLPLFRQDQKGKFSSPARSSPQFRVSR